MRPRKLKSQDEKESSIARALKGLRSGVCPSIRNATAINSIAYTTLQRRFHGGITRAAIYECQQLVIVAEERAMVRSICQLGLAALLPQIEHVQEAVMILGDNPDDLDQVIGKKCITRFFDRHPELVAKFCSAFGKKEIKASDPKILKDHFSRLGGLIRKFDVPEDMWFNMDEKGFMMGKSDRFQVICGHRGRGITGKLAQDGNRELIIVLKTICGDGTVLQPLIIYKGAK